MLCSPGPVTTLVDLSLCPEHRRGHGVLYDGVSCGAIEIKGLQFAIAALKLPRDRAVPGLLRQQRPSLVADRILRSRAAAGGPAADSQLKFVSRRVNCRSKWRSLV